MPGQKPSPKNAKKTRATPRPKAKPTKLVREATRVQNQTIPPARRAFGPNAGQMAIVKLNVVPDSNRFLSLCASLVQYALPRGLPRSQAAPTFLAVQVVLIAAMKDASANILKKAPRIYWKIENGLRPKTVFHKGIQYQYSWDMTSLTPATDPNPLGNAFGDVGSEVGTTGLLAISTSAVSIPVLQDAIGLLDELWGYYGDGHPLMGAVEDQLFDAGFFAYKVGAFDQQANPNDGGVSMYGIIQSETPCASWLTYAGIGSSDITVGTVSFPRVFAYACYAQGSPESIVGLRLVFPVTMSKKYNMTGVDYCFVDLQGFLTQAMYMLDRANAKLISAARVDANTAGAAPLSYTGNGVTKNQMLLYRYATIISHFAPTSCLWAGVSGGVCAVMVGTNNIDMTLLKGRSEQYWLKASLNQLKPMYNKKSNWFTIPVPTINEDAIAAIWTLFPNVLVGDTTPSLGGIALDLLNSNNGTASLLSLIDGPSFRDDQLFVGRGDAAITEVLPTVGAQVTGEPSQVPVMNTNSVLTEESHGLGQPSKIQERFFGYNAQGQDKALALSKYLLIKTKHSEMVAQAKRVAEEARKNKVNVPNEFLVLASNRSNPDLTMFNQNGDISVQPQGVEAQLDNVLFKPIQIVADPNNVDNLRVVHQMAIGTRSGTTPANGYMNSQISITDEFPLDPNSAQTSQVGAAMLDLSKGVFESIVPGFGGVLDNVISGLGPEWGIGVKLGGAVVQGLKSIVPRIRARRQARLAGRRR